MSRYTVLKKSFINGRLLYPGEEVEFSGEAGNNLQLIVTAASDESHSDDNSGGGHQSDGEGNSGAGTGNDGNGGDHVSDAELTALRDQYQELFGKPAHHKTGADKLRTEIDAKRKELGV